MTEQSDNTRITWLSPDEMAALLHALDIPEGTPALDWIRHLPADAQVAMASELTNATPEERAAHFAAWQSTALVYADPELLAALTSDHHCDGGPVPMPEARTWPTRPGVEWTLGQLQTDTTPLPMPRPEYRYESMMDQPADPDRSLRLEAGFALAHHLGTPEGRAEITAAGHQDGQHIVVVLTGDSDDYVNERISGHDGAVTLVRYEPNSRALSISSGEDWQYEQAMRGRKRGSSDD